MQRTTACSFDPLPGRRYTVPMRITPVITLAVSLFVASAHAQSPPAPAAPADDAVTRTITALEAQHKAQPGDALVTFMLASYYVQGKLPDKAIATLDTISDNQLGIFPSPDRFHDIAHLPGYREVMRKFERSQPPVLRGRVAVVLDGPPMATEGIAYDARDGSFYLSSVDRKIVRISRDGKHSDFTTVGQDGMATPLGMKLDAQRGLLWAASYRDAEMGGDGQPGLYAFDLRTGKTVEKHLPTGTSPATTFNDLVVTREGTVYVTDTSSGALYRVERGGTLQPYLPAGTFRGANGVALSPDEKFLIVAQWRAPVRVELATGKALPLTVPAGVVTAGIDGLYFHGRHLIAVQNVAHPGRVLRLSLNETFDAITGAEVLESRSPHFAVPTTAAIVGDTAYVLANSYVGWLKPGGKLFNGDSMQGTVILAVPLG